MNELVAILSPYNHPTAEGRKRNLDYARAAAHDCLARGEVPIAIHLILGDADRAETPSIRAAAMEASKCILDTVDKVAVYIDLGTSTGMREEIGYISGAGKTIDYRTIPWSNPRAVQVDGWAAYPG